MWGVIGILMKVETAIGGYVIQTFDPGILVKSVLIAFRNTPSDLSNDIMQSYQIRRIWREGRKYLSFLCGPQRSSPIRLILCLSWYEHR